MRLCCAALCVSMLSYSLPAIAGPDWIEGSSLVQTDAGSTFITAERVVGIASLRSISGSLSFGAGIEPSLTSPDFEDMYVIRINVASTFSFEVVNAQFDAQLFLFNITQPGEAFGLLANNDTPLSTAPRLVRPATDATGADVVLPGVYAIAISGVGRVPVSAGGPIFSFGSPTEVSGPDGPGGINPHTGWEGIGQTGTYVINVQDVGWYDVPAPSAGLMVFGGAGLFGLRRRSRR